MSTESYSSSLCTEFGVFSTSNPWISKAPLQLPPSKTAFPCISQMPIHVTPSSREPPTLGRVQPRTTPSEKSRVAVVFRRTAILVEAAVRNYTDGIGIRLNYSSVFSQNDVESRGGNGRNWIRSFARHSSVYGYRPPTNVSMKATIGKRKRKFKIW